MFVFSDIQTIREFSVQNLVIKGRCIILNQKGMIDQKQEPIQMKNIEVPSHSGQISEQVQPEKHLKSNYLQDSLNNIVEKPIAETIIHTPALAPNLVIYRESQNHLVSFFTTIIMVIGMIRNQNQYNSHKKGYGRTLQKIQHYTLYILQQSIFYFWNQINSYLPNINLKGTLKDKYETISALQSKFHLTVTCFHEQRTWIMNVIYKIFRSEFIDSLQYKSQVITHTANEFITPACTEDVSGPIAQIQTNKDIVFIQFFVKYEYKNEDSRQKMQDIMYTFQDAHRIDILQKYGCTYETPELVSKQAFFMTSNNHSYKFWLYVFAIFGLAWPYSLWMESKIQRYSVFIKKVISL